MANLDGLNQVEKALNTGVIVVPIVLWSFFLWSLWSTEMKTRWFLAVMILHLAPLALMLPIILMDPNQRQALPFFRFGLFGGLALIIGLPHYLWEPGQRLRPRLVVTLGVVLVFGALYAWIMSGQK